jgi:hypothetical protein
MPDATAVAPPVAGVVAGLLMVELGKMWQSVGVSRDEGRVWRPCEMTKIEESLTHTRLQS